MTRDELRAALEAKGITVGDWPTVRHGDLLVVDEWGCSAAMFVEPMPEYAVELWAEKIDGNGGWCGGPYPDGAVAYTIDHEGAVMKLSLHTEFTPKFYARRA